MPYKARQDDLDFAEAYARRAGRSLRRPGVEPRRRAHDGVDEPVVYQGELMGCWVMPDGAVVSKDTPGATLVPLTVKKYSDALLLALLKASTPRGSARTT